MVRLQDEFSCWKRNHFSSERLIHPFTIINFFVTDQSVFQSSNKNENEKKQPIHIVVFVVSNYVLLDHH